MACAAHLDAATPPAAGFVLGFTLTNADPLGRPVADREQMVVRAWAKACRGHGLTTHRPFDNAADADNAPPRSHDGTLTTWITFEPP